MGSFTINTHHAYLNNYVTIKAESQITIIDTVTRQEYKFQGELKIHLSAGTHILKSDEHEETIIIEDAIKLGGSQIKSAFVFDNAPWIFVTTKDRLYITNSETHEEKVEYNITPDEIMSLPTCARQIPNDYFLFKTNDDYAIYNASTSKIVFQFKNHIYSNNHLVVFKKEDDSIEVYDFHISKTIVNFKSQYSFGSKLYFIKDKKLYGLDFNTSLINEIPFVENVEDDDMLFGNHLLRLRSDFYKKNYIYFSLGDGEDKTSMSNTQLICPYYIESWDGKSTPHFTRAKENLQKFNEECNKNNMKYSDIYSMCLGIRINNEIYRHEEGKRMIEFHGEIMTYPDMKFTVPFVVKGEEGKVIDFQHYVIETPQVANDGNYSETKKELFSLEKGEKNIGESDSGNLIITQYETGIYVHDLKKNERQRIMQTIFDTSHYENAYFTSDGRNVFLRVNHAEAQLLGLDNLTTKSFEIDGFTLTKNEGYNGYTPEISFSNSRKPVWRDPITLNFIPEEEMSSHVFRSPDGAYIADNQMKTIIINRLTKSEIKFDEIEALKKKYDWNTNATENEKKAIRKNRKELAAKSNKYDLFGKIIETYDIYNNDQTEKRNQAIENAIERYITKECNFTPLIIDVLGYVCYRKNEEGAKEMLIPIGRSVYFLNYVSFSYDSKYLSFAAKMKNDEFRYSQDGVFVIFDLEKKEIIKRIDNNQLWAVWMTIFSKNGDVAFYDSCANAYLLHKSDNYKHIEEAPGKSLLCFSPSGRYIACSDQNYIDYTHHPEANWGHQPSGNVFIHKVDDFQNCIEQYNDLGDSVSGVATRAGNVSSAAFSQDETKLLVVGNDGVVVVRNLKKTTRNDEKSDDVTTICSF